MLGWWDDQPSNPAYYIEDCRIYVLTYTLYEFKNFHNILYLAKAVDWGASVDPIKCYIGAVGAEIEETCDSGTCEKTGSMYQ